MPGEGRALALDVPQTREGEVVGVDEEAVVSGPIEDVLAAGDRRGLVQVPGGRPGGVGELDRVVEQVAHAQQALTLGPKKERRVTRGVTGRRAGVEAGEKFLIVAERA